MKWILRLVAAVTLFAMGYGAASMLKDGRSPAADYDALWAAAVSGSPEDAFAAYRHCSEELKRDEPDQRFRGECGALRMLWLENEIASGDPCRFDQAMKLQDSYEDDHWTRRRSIYVKLAAGVMGSRSAEACSASRAPRE